MEYVYNTLNPVLTVRRLYTVHYFKYARGFSAPGERHNFWELVYLDGGEAEIVADDRVFMLRQGEAVFHKPNEFHNIMTHEKYASSAIVSFECGNRAMNFFKEKVLTFSAYQKELLNRIVLEAGRTYSEKLNRVELVRMNKKDRVPFGAEQIIKNNLELLLIDLLRGSDAVDQEQLAHLGELRLGNTVVAEIVSLLAGRVYGTLTLEELANLMFFSKTYLKRVFAAQMGTGIMQYYNALKLEEAKKLLSEGRLTVTEIADRLCFGSVHYFSRAFKQHTNLSPTQYAKSLKLDNLIR